MSLRSGSRWPRILLLGCAAVVPSRLLGQERPSVASLPAPPGGVWFAEAPWEGKSRLFGLSLTADRRWHGDQPLYLFTGDLRSGDVLCAFADLEVLWPGGERLSFDCTSFSQGRRRPNGARVELTFGSQDREVTVVWQHDGASTTLLLRTLPQTGQSHYVGDWVMGSSPLSNVLHLYQNPSPIDPQEPREFLDEFNRDNLIATFDNPSVGFYGKPVALNYGWKKDPDVFTFSYWGAGHDLFFDGRFDAVAQEIRGTNWRGERFILQRAQEIGER